MSDTPGHQRDSSPIWSQQTFVPPFPTLDHDLDTDVLVVGGGVTGLTTAYLLVATGRSVVVVERGRCIGGDTGHTTAHLTMVTDTTMSTLVDRFGASHAQAVWDAGLATLARIDAIVREHSIDCDFAWVDGYRHVPTGQSAPQAAESLRAEAERARGMGFDIEYVEQTPLFGTPGIRVSDQARLHPLKYLAGLARVVVDTGGRIFEHSGVESFSASPRSVVVNGHVVRFRDVVLATHNPLVGLSATADAAYLQTKLTLFTSAVVAAWVEKGRVPDALWWDTTDPYRYLRIQPGGDRDLVIYGGEDYKTGQAEACYATLERDLHALLPGCQPMGRWSGQVIDTSDGLPFIGQTSEHQFVATGFGGNGMTFGTLGAMMAADALLGRSNPWTTLFDPKRTAITTAIWDYVKHNADYPYYLIRDRFAGVEARPLRAIARGEGAFIERGGKTLAAYRDASGAVTLLSPTCTHMGCRVTWNGTERTWDCPCHGSRFAANGEVLSGPAETRLPAESS